MEYTSLYRRFRPQTFGSILGQEHITTTLKNQVINNRVDEMLKNGLIKEAKELFDNNVNTNSIIGYKELNEYFKGDIDLDAAIEKIKKNTRHYAKRQITWINNQFENKIEVKVNYNNFNTTINEVLKIIKES